MSSSQVVCKFCTAQNRLDGFSVKKRPWCGKCGKPLGEPVYIRLLRYPYRYPRLVFIAAIGLLAIWATKERISDYVAMSLNCREIEAPAGGLFARYISLPRTVELNLITPVGVNYFVKLAQADTAKPALSIFVHGGDPTNVKVPAGRFTLKAASGDRWCGETNLFGSETRIVESGRSINFEPGQIHTVTLASRPNGNLPVRPIERGTF